MSTAHAKGRSEEVEQARFVKWTHKQAVRALMPQLAWLHHSPNGGQRSAFTGAQMTALGVKRGFPDLILPVASSGRPGLAIEFKRPDGTGRLSAEQSAWLDHFSAQNWQTDCVKTAQDARSLVCQYLDIPPDSAPELD